ncbi:N-acetyltransferase [Dactylellina cionopaga]|nr:N-acetyltransferase [Dactylellina cionopaga]
MTQPNATASLHLRPATPVDVPQITTIVNHYIAHTTVNHCYRLLPLTHYGSILSDATSRNLPFIVAVETASETADIDNEDTETSKIIGFATVGFFISSKLGFAHTLELSIYISPMRRSGGVGTALLETIIHELETKDYLTFAEGGALIPSSTSASTPGQTTTVSPTGIPVRCRKLLAVMAVDADPGIAEGLNRFYVKNGFKEVGLMNGLVWKFGTEQDVKFLMKDLNVGYVPAEVGGFRY